MGENLATLNLSRNISVSKALSGQTLLVTGSTGFLGKVWLAQLLHHAPVKQVILLCRAGKTKSGQKQTAAERVQHMFESSPAFRALKKTWGDAYSERVHDIIRVIEGDAEIERFGLTEPEWTGLAEEVDAVVHIAGLTDFMPDPKLALATNIEGALMAQSLAALTKHKAMLHVSTCYVAGANEGDVAESIPEGLSPYGVAYDPRVEFHTLHAMCKHKDKKIRKTMAQHRALSLGFPNTYTYTKGLAEQLLCMNAKEKKVHLSIVRPSIVEGAQFYPFAGWNEGINTSGPLAWLISKPIRGLPMKEDNLFDVIPVDEVCKGMTLVMAETMSRPDSMRGTAVVFHLGSSDANPTTFARMISLTTEGHKKHGAHSGRIEELMQRWTASYATNQSPKEDVGLQLAKVSNQLAQRLRGYLDEHKVLTGISPHLDMLQDRFRGLSVMMDQQLRVVNKIVDIFEPFVFQYNWKFTSQHIKVLTTSLPAEEGDTWGFHPERIDWQSYWVDAQIPGLIRYAFPLMEGKAPKEDFPMPIEIPMAWEPAPIQEKHLVSTNTEKKEQHAWQL